MKRNLHRQKSLRFTLHVLQKKSRVAFDIAARQLDRLVQNYPDHFPMYTVNGKWMHSGESWINW